MFVIHECKNKNLDSSKINMQRRLRTDETLNTFRNDLLAQDWRNVHEKEDVDSAYNFFLNTFLTLYHKNCPIQQPKRTPKRPDNPWLTRGLLNACKKRIIYIKTLLSTELRRKKLNIRHIKIN